VRLFLSLSFLVELSPWRGGAGKPRCKIAITGLLPKRLDAVARLFRDRGWSVVRVGDTAKMSADGNRLTPERLVDEYAYRVHQVMVIARKCYLLDQRASLVQSELEKECQMLADRDEVPPSSLWYPAL